MHYRRTAPHPGPLPIGWGEAGDWQKSEGLRCIFLGFSIDFQLRMRSLSVEDQPCLARVVFLRLLLKEPD
jgi:hypothetical protein